MNRIGTGRAFAALFGAPVVAWMVGASMVAFLPMSMPWAFAIGGNAIIPLWVALACVLPLLPSGKAAWALCGAVVLACVIPLWVRHG